MHKKIKQLQLRSKSIGYRDLQSIATLDETRAKKLKEQLADDEFAAYFCVWGVRDTYGTGWVKGCFAKSIRERGPASKANQKIAVCWQHDMRDPIGQPIEIVEDDFGAYVKGKFDDFESVPNAKRAASQIRSGTLNGFSFGFDYLWDKMEYEEDTDTIWVKETDLYEISPVTFASIKETKAIRSVEDYDRRMAFLKEESEHFLKTLTRTKQLELRQILYDYQTLAELEPSLLRTLEDDKPDEDTYSVGGLKINLNKL